VEKSPCEVGTPASRGYQAAAAMYGVRREMGHAHEDALRSATAITILYVPPSEAREIAARAALLWARSHERDHLGARLHAWGESRRVPGVPRPAADRSGTWRLTCLIDACCFQTCSLIAMQEHQMDAHGISRRDLMLAERWPVDDGLDHYQWSFPSQDQLPSMHADRITRPTEQHP